MSYTFTSTEMTKYDITLKDNKELQIKVYLGGKWGRFFYERITIFSVSVYLTLLLSVIVFEEYLAFKGYIPMLQILYFFICLYLDFLLAKGPFRIVYGKVRKFLFIRLHNFVMDKPTYIFDLSNEPEQYNDSIYMKYFMPPTVLLGFRMDRNGLRFMDHHRKVIAVKVNGLFEDNDKEEIRKIVAKHLGLTKNKISHPIDISDLDYIDLEVHEKMTQNDEYQSDIPYNLHQQLAENMRQSRSMNLLSTVIIIVCLLISVYLIDLATLAYTKPNVFSFMFFSSLAILFGLITIFSLFFVDYFHEPLSIYNPNNNVDLKPDLFI